MDFDAEAYWASREVKVWVVVLSQRDRGRKRGRVDRKFVRARTQQGAVATARENSFMDKIVNAYARLATPADLGCVPTPTTDAGE